MNLALHSFFFLLFISSSCKTYAQHTHTISGVVKEASTGETLIGTNIYIGNGRIGTTSNEYGFYTLTVPEDTLTIVFSFIGYQSVIHQFYLAAIFCYNYYPTDNKSQTLVHWGKYSMNNLA